MLCPSLLPTRMSSCPGGTILFEQERDMPHGYFGDRDAGRPAQDRGKPAACGLFGRLIGDPPLRPANDSPGDRPRPSDPDRA